MWKNQNQKFKHYFHFNEKISVKSSKSNRFISLQKYDFKYKNHPKSNPPTEYTKTNRICHKGSAGLTKSYRITSIRPTLCGKSYRIAPIHPTEYPKSYRICSIRPTLYGKTYRIAQSSRPNAAKPVFRNKKKDYKGKHSYIYAYIFSLALARVIPFFIILLLYL